MKKENQSPDNITDWLRVLDIRWQETNKLLRELIEVAKDPTYIHINEEN